MTLTTIHLLFIALWGGVLACEGIIEFVPTRHEEQERLVAKLHFRIDVLLEAPLLVGILVTGIVLLAGTPWTTLLAIKVAGALVVILANAACIVVVVRRYLATRDAPNRPLCANIPQDTRLAGNP